MPPNLPAWIFKLFDFLSERWEPQNNLKLNVAEPLMSVIYSILIQIQAHPKAAFSPIIF